MKLLAIDSSGLVASVCMLAAEPEAKESVMLAEFTINHKKTHSQTLLPMLDEMLKTADLSCEDADFLCLAEGPGSFTGLRIGEATIKGLGLVLNKPVIGVPTVDSLAYNLFGVQDIICPVMDARRNQVYTGLYIFERDVLVPVLPQCAMSVEEITQQINQQGKSVIYLGDGVPVYEELLRTMTKVPYRFAPPHISRQRAGCVAALAYQYIKQGIQGVPVAEHTPTYLRLSQAEREKAEKRS